MTRAEDHERIWLQNAADAKHSDTGRLWCQDKVWPDDAEDGEPTEYVRADLFEAALSENDRLRKALAFADEQSAKVEALLEPHIKWECASEDCSELATIRFERGGIGSYYCHACYMRIQALSPITDERL